MVSRDVHKKTTSNGPADHRRLHSPVGMKPQRLDRFLAEHEELKLSRTRIQKLIDEGRINVNDVHVAAKYLLTGGEKIDITIPKPVEITVSGEDIPLEFAYQDEHLVVVNKPAGMVTHPAPGHHQATLVNALLHYFRDLPADGAKERPGIIHRLDKNTSGLLLVARREEVQLLLQKAMAARQIKRTYTALVCGHMNKLEGKIEEPIGRSSKDRKMMAVTDKGSRDAITHYRVVDRFRAYDQLEVQLQTGRTHQIRVHLSHLGHPVLGDPEYGGREKWHKGVFAPERLLAKKLLKVISRQALHAARLEFVHPITRTSVLCESDLPEDMQNVLALLNKEGR